jgi:AraC family transcriptional regulator of arabinose operon
LLERALILAKEGEREAPLRPQDPRIQRVLKLIEALAPAPPTGAELRIASGLSPSLLSSLFRKQVGISLIAAVNRARLRSAKYALLDPTRKMEDIAAQTGFQSPYAFSNWFLRQTGQRPGSFRRNPGTHGVAKPDDRRRA